MWVVVTRIQTKDPKTFLAAAHDIYEEEGVIGFFHGISMNMIMIAYPTIRHFSLEVMQFLKIYFASAHIAQGICASLASVFATIVTYPIQRWRLQLQAGGHCKSSGLFNGLGFKLLHSGFTNFILFALMSSSEEVIDYLLTE
jgi:hypothetical protein